MHTQFQPGGQSGATIPATAKPEKKNKDISGGVKSNILKWCSVALRRVVGLERGRRSKGSIGRLDPLKRIRTVASASRRQLPRDWDQRTSTGRQSRVSSVTFPGTFLFFELYAVGTDDQLFPTYLCSYMVNIILSCRLSRIPIPYLTIGPKVGRDNCHSAVLGLKHTVYVWFGPPIRSLGLLIVSRQ